MNKGIRGWARPRNKRYVSEAQVIDTTNGNTFRHGFGRVPGECVVRLRCVTANNGYAVGEEIPLDSIWANDGNNDDGGPYRTIRLNVASVLVWLGNGIYAFFPANAAPVTANVANITLSQWKLVVRCSDIERVV